MAAGPSPRARGSQVRAVEVRAVEGSIPASAGEPDFGDPAVEAEGVHPRERGGAQRTSRRAASVGGPSPRARGSRSRSPTASRASGSIPASAGEPLAEPDGVESVRVHPRERGGALDGHALGQCPAGPSPRARGSLAFELIGAIGDGSIPASAGEPRARASTSAARGVHPRERGGAAVSDIDIDAATGPSPRARGSRSRSPTASRASGSIPASAGEPTTTAARRGAPRVHPRERGGAVPRWPPGRSPEGPSPRARGSRLLHRLHQRERGSIPASAGEPRPTGSRTSRGRVHPRERGGARLRLEINLA